LKVLDQEAKLLGLYQPQKVELDAKLNHSGKLEIKLSEEELQNEIDADLKKLIEAGYIQDPEKNH
jgi:hypothetical protein